MHRVSIDGSAIEVTGLAITRRIERDELRSYRELLHQKVLLRGRGLFSLEPSREDPRPSVFLALVFPPFALALRAFDFHLLVEPLPLVALGAASGGLLAALAIRADKRTRLKVVLFLFLTVVLGLYAVAAVVEANCAFDDSRPRVFAAQVDGKWVSQVGMSSSYSLRLSPWGPQRGQTDVHVSRPLHERLSPGQTVEVWLYSGRLGMPWFTVVS